MGYALGVVHLSYDDFCRLTPEEFGAVCKAYGEHYEATVRNDWEVMRMLATITIQPHCKKKITPKKLLPFAWDHKPKSNVPVLSKEQTEKRVEELLKRIG